ncbi:unnamed protein product [Tuber melanosporum]|uniref:(Perigord truffle) hypothetical protein n=1 Tax=Tuber melanosporum (strain Mel28) TaxID=656061 RepID=D5GNS4_TUBMM|nr:uncharacterized protein GSTUM_00011410001 [Tuber melanosporum]CAZ86140.1 unnamed protein product [Tuber melanosporum]
MACCQTLRAWWGRGYWRGDVVCDVIFDGWVHGVYHGSMTCGSDIAFALFICRTHIGSEGAGLFPLILFVHYLGLLIGL